MIETRFAVLSANTEGTGKKVVILTRRAGCVWPFAGRTAAHAILAFVGWRISEESVLKLFWNKIFIYSKSVNFNYFLPLIAILETGLI